MLHTHPWNNISVSIYALTYDLARRTVWSCCVLKHEELLIWLTISSIGCTCNAPSVRRVPQRLNICTRSVYMYTPNQNLIYYQGINRKAAESMLETIKPSNVDCSQNYLLLAAIYRAGYRGSRYFRCHFESSVTMPVSVIGRYRMTRNQRPGACITIKAPSGFWGKTGMGLNFTLSIYGARPRQSIYIWRTCIVWLEG